MTCDRCHHTAGALFVRPDLGALCEQCKRETDALILPAIRAQRAKEDAE